MQIIEFPFLLIYTNFQGFWFNQTPHKVNVSFFEHGISIFKRGDFQKKNTNYFKRDS